METVKVPVEEWVTLDPPTPVRLSPVDPDTPTRGHRVQMLTPTGWVTDLRAVTDPYVGDDGRLHVDLVDERGWYVGGVWRARHTRDTRGVPLLYVEH